MADKLAIPLETIAGDDLYWADPPEPPTYLPPEPGAIPYAVPDMELLRRAAANSRVLLTGLGGDPALTVRPSYWSECIRRGQWRKLLDTQRHARKLGGPGPRSLLRGALYYARSRQGVAPVLPACDSRRVRPPRRPGDQAARDQRALDVAARSAGHVESPFWPALLGRAHSGYSGSPIEIRFPFFDLRLVSLLDRIPPLPLLIGKRLLRVAMQDRLPEAVLRRAKTPLGLNPRLVSLQQDGARPWIHALFGADDEIARFVDPKAVGDTGDPAAAGDPANRIAGAIDLAFWLRYRWSLERHPQRRRIAEARGARLAVRRGGESRRVGCQGLDEDFRLQTSEGRA